MTDELPLIFDRIRDLLDEAEAGVGSSELAEIEHTLTDGYASALALEGERWRTEKRIGELALRLNDPAQARELHALALSLSSADEELARLRALLGVLRDHAELLRTAANAGQTL